MRNCFRTSHSLLCASSVADYALLLFIFWAGRLPRDFIMRFCKPKTNVSYKWHIKLRNTSSAMLLFGTCCCCCVNGKIYYVGLKPEWNTTCLHVLFSTLLNPSLFWTNTARPCRTVAKPFWTSVARLLEMLSPNECFTQDTLIRGLVRMSLQMPALMWQFIFLSVAASLLWGNLCFKNGVQRTWHVVVGPSLQSSFSSFSE